MWEEMLLQRGFLSHYPVSRDVIYSLLQDYYKERDIASGRNLHSLLVLNDLDKQVVLGDHLIRLFIACGTLLEANIVFCSLSQPSIHTWQAIISGHTVQNKHGMSIQLYERMQHEGICPDEFIFSSILKACGKVKDISYGRCLHNGIVLIGLECNVVLGSSLVDMYVKCGHIVDARSVFDSMPSKNIVSWGAMMAGYVHYNENGLAVLDLFKSMEEQGIQPDQATILCTLNACSSMRAVTWGRIVHAKIIESFLASGPVLGNTLVEMYVKCGSMEEARNVFNKLSDRTVVSYAAIIRGYIEHRDVAIAMQLFRDMLLENIEGNDVLFLHIVKACGQVGVTGVGRLFHVQIVENGLDMNLIIGSALIDMYAKCGSLQEAHNLLILMPHRDVVLWGIIISAYLELDRGDVVLQLFKEMQIEGTKADEVIMLGVVKASGDTKDIGYGRSMHDQIIKNMLELKTTLGNALVDMYVRCGSLDEAMNTIYRLPNRNVVTWNSLIAGCACDDNDAFALNIFKKMQQDDVKPDVFTFSTLLNICSRVGSIQHGEIVHEQMLRSGIKLDVVIETILVDMYAKCGYLRDAQKILESMPHRDVMSYNALISAYTQHGHCKAAIECFNGLRERGLKPNADTYANILAACNHSGALLEARYFLKSMRDEEGIVLGIEHINSIIDLLARLGLLNEAEKLLETMPGVAGIIGWRSLLASCKTYGNPMLGRQCYDEAVSIEAEIQYSGPKPT